MSWLSRLFSPWNGLREGPVVDRYGESTRKGIFVAGDLADAPVIKSALRDGDTIGKSLCKLLEGEAQAAIGFDVVVVGAGPAGAACVAALKAGGRSVVAVERHRPFHTLDAFPAGKILYSDPPGVKVPEAFQIGDATKEEVVQKWTAAVVEGDIPIRGGDVVDIDGDDGAFRVLLAEGDPIHARKIVLAVGRRGTPRRLAVKGGERAWYELPDPAAWRDRPTLVIGGGDSAVEAAVALADAGSTVILAHRGDRLVRPKKKNLGAITRAVADGRLTVRANAQLELIEEGYATISGQKVDADAVFVQIGTDLPLKFLSDLGLQLKGDRRAEQARIPMYVLGFIGVYLFYALKQGRSVFPFNLWPLDQAHDWLTFSTTLLPTVDGSPRVLDPGFFGTLIYSFLILSFGLAAMRKWPSWAQRKRYLSLIGFQWLFLFGIPEILAPAVTAASGKLYSLSVPWPLSIWSLAHEPSQVGWLAVGAFTSFVLVPAYVWRKNESFCSWLCGCGGLAETVGDMWRWRSPRGKGAKTAEWGGRIVLLLAIPTTLLILNDLWGLVGFHTWLEQDVKLGRSVEIMPSAPDADRGDMRISDAKIEKDGLHISIQKLESDDTWHDNGWIREVRYADRVLYPEKIAEGQYLLPTDGLLGGTITVISDGSSLSRATDFAKGWYSLMVDFALASVIGVAMYPMLGNRVWCRFFCPLRAYMEILASAFGRLAIKADSRCISCGECTTNCQMGIDVQGFAEHQLRLDNTNSACIQCGVCVEVCPLGVLTLVDAKKDGLAPARPNDVGPRW